MMSRTQITLTAELQRRARQRASDLSASLAEHVRRSVARDFSRSPRAANPAAVFDMGASGGSDVAKDKDVMVAEAFALRNRKSARR